jgi:regulator of protease activity HflC (stomatin/prohibitin superfamily)
MTELYQDPDTLCHLVKNSLGSLMKDNGYTILNTLVTNIEPDKEIQNAMNKVVASERLRQAAQNEADAEYIKSVRLAEADRDRKRLQGEGIAMQRQAILDGYRDSLSKMKEALGISAQEALNLTSKTMYYDTLERIGTSNNTRTLFLNHSAEQEVKKDVTLLEALESFETVKQQNTGV